MRSTQADIEAHYRNIEQAYTRVTKAIIYKDSNSYSAVLTTTAISFLQPNYINTTMHIAFNQDKLLSIVPTLESSSDIITYSYSHQGKLKLVFLRKQLNNECKIVLQLWDGYFIKQEIETPCSEIYTDPIFGNICWSYDNLLVAFIGEPIPPKYNTYYSTDDNSKLKAQCKYEHINSLGEKMSDKHSSTLYIYDLHSNSVETLNTSDQIGSMAQRPQFDINGDLYFNAIANTNYNLSPFCCLNRKSSIYKAHKNAQWKYTQITNEYITLGHFVNGSSLIYFASDEEFIQHNMCISLKRIDLSTSKCYTIIKPHDSADAFKGIYTSFSSPVISSNCGSVCNGKYCVFPTHHHDIIKTLIVNICTGCIFELNTQFPGHSCDLLCVNHDCLLVRVCSISCCPRYYAVHITEHEEQVVPNWILLFECKPILNSKDYIKQEIRSPNAYGYLVKSVSNQVKPLIVILHGGPHSVSIDAYTPLTSLYLLLGYNIFYINYRGSIGYGSDYLIALTHNIGKSDVQDCGELLELAAQDRSVDRANIFISGISHGGFLGCWMNVHPKYSSLINCGAVRNPVCNLVAMSQSTDMPDWCVANALGSKFSACNLHEEDIKQMYSISPVKQVGNCAFGMMLIVGKKDRRVICEIGREFYSGMIANKKECVLYELPDDSHPIDSLNGNLMQMINTLLWFEQHKKL